MTDSRSGASNPKGTGARGNTGRYPVDPVRVDKALQALARVQEARRRQPQRSEDPATQRSKQLGRMRAGGVPTRYLEAAWDQVSVPELREWQAHVLLGQRLKAGRGLLLFGTTGVGKSSVAALLCGEAIKLDRSIRWEYVPDMLDALEKGSRYEAGDKTARLGVKERQRQAGLLVWDDFGVDRLADWQVGLLDRIVEHRYRTRRPMIVTTNVTPTALANDPSLGRIVDRWRQMLTGITIEGPSRRRPE